MNLKLTFFFIISVLIFASCSSPLNNIKNNNFKFSENKPIADLKVQSKLIELIKEKRKDNSEGLEFLAIVIFSKENVTDNELSNFAITNFVSLSDIYNYPCSGYVIVDNVLVLIYDKSKGYINPVNYPKTFLTIAKKHLIDDWTRKRINCINDTFTLSGSATNHSNLIIVKNGNTQTKKYFEFDIGKLFYNKRGFQFTNYYNLDNFRTVYPDNCQ